MAGEIRDLTTKVGLTCPGVGHGDAGQVTCAPMTRRPTCTQGGKIFWCYAHQTAPTGKPFGILPMFHAQGIGSLFQSQTHSIVRL